MGSHDRFEAWFVSLNNSKGLHGRTKIIVGDDQDCSVGEPGILQNLSVGAVSTVNGVACQACLLDNAGVELQAHIGDAFLLQKGPDHLSGPAVSANDNVVLKCGWLLAYSRFCGLRLRFRAKQAVAQVVTMVHQERTDRSEERRVGKECRSRWSAAH